MRQVSLLIVFFIFFSQMALTVFAERKPEKTVEIFIDGQKFKSMEEYKKFKIQSYLEQKDKGVTPDSEGTSQLDSAEAPEKDAVSDEDSYVSELEANLKTVLQKRKDHLSFSLNPSKMKTIDVSVPRVRTIVIPKENKPDVSVQDLNKKISVSQDPTALSFDRIIQILSDLSASVHRVEEKNSLSSEFIPEDIPKSSLKNIEEDDLEKMFKTFNRAGFYRIDEEQISPSEKKKGVSAKSTGISKDIGKEFSDSPFISSEGKEKKELMEEVSQRDLPQSTSVSKNLKRPQSPASSKRFNDISKEGKSFSPRENNYINDDASLGIENPPIVIDRTQTDHPVVHVSIGKMGQLKNVEEGKKRKEN